MTREELLRLPKVELHCHLDGSLSKEFIEKRLGRSVKKEELSDEFSSSHVADSSSTFAYLDYIMNFLKVNVRDLAKAKYEDTYLLTTFKLHHVF